MGYQSLGNWVSREQNHRRDQEFSPCPCSPGGNILEPVLQISVAGKITILNDFMNFKLVFWNFFHFSWNVCEIWIIATLMAQKSPPIRRVFVRIQWVRIFCKHSLGRILIRSNYGLRDCNPPPKCTPTLRAYTIYIYIYRVTWKRARGRKKFFGPEFSSGSSCYKDGPDLIYNFKKKLI